MKIYEKEAQELPWPAIHEYLVEVGSARTKRELLKKSVAGLSRIIPYDSCAGAFSVAWEILFADGLSGKEQHAYNEHYRIMHRQKYAKKRSASSSRSPLVFCSRPSRAYENSEFYVDFARPNRLELFMAALAPNRGILLLPFRSRQGPGFTKKEACILEVVTVHVNNFYSIFSEYSMPASLSPTQDAILERFPQLTNRESQIGQLICGRLSTAEIASKLFVDVRTVETHLAHLYRKIGVQSKCAAISRLVDDRDR
jgi:DNA-binding CsgD family transcriptional regulator